ncbi:uncharacterized protein LOC131668540 [Phymastichus coffea]|uniref:uncharacterized protein LOC131668540 n=1 Tax=Phymastichus coffea TaxID=108790 RepID=UPI00273BFB58|nr:uncharacterized protein LOC131668540 [Phymastichus coffea]
MNRGRRNFHSYWKEGGFEPVKREVSSKNNTSVTVTMLKAWCKVCKRDLANTPIVRLRNHRKSCIFHTDSETTTTVSSNDVNGNAVTATNVEEFNSTSTVEKDNDYNSALESANASAKRKERKLLSRFQPEPEQAIQLVSRQSVSSVGPYKLLQPPKKRSITKIIR